MNSGMNQTGFTLLEIVIAMFVSLIVLASVIGTFAVQSKYFERQSQVAEIRENARAGIVNFENELMNAGYVPEAPAQAPDQDVSGLEFENIDEADTKALTFVADIDGDAKTETVRYSWGGTPGDPLTRQVWEWQLNSIPPPVGSWVDSGGAQTIAESIQDLSFSYFDNSNSVMAAPVGPPNRPGVRRIAITLTVKTKKGDRTQQLGSSLTPRNLAIDP